MPTSLKQREKESKKASKREGRRRERGVSERERERERDCLPGRVRGSMCLLADFLACWIWNNRKWLDT